MLQPRGKVAWPCGGRREGSVDTSESIRGNTDRPGDDRTGDVWGLACAHEGPFSEMGGTSEGHGLGPDMWNPLLGPQELRGI